MRSSNGSRLRLSSLKSRKNDEKDIMSSGNIDYLIPTLVTDLTTYMTCSSDGPMRGLIGSLVPVALLVHKPNFSHFNQFFDQSCVLARI